MELGNLLENFKTFILGTINSQLDTINIKSKLEDEVLTIFYPRCRKNHAAKNCPLNNVSVCAICTRNHETGNCPSLPELQAIYKEANEFVGPIFQVAPRKHGNHSHKVFIWIPLHNFINFYLFPLKLNQFLFILK